jgi:hypothetical protein
MKTAVRLALNLAALSATTFAKRIAQRRSPRSVDADSTGDPSNLTLLGLGLLALVLGYRK